MLDEESPKIIQSVESKNINQESSTKMNDIQQWLLVSNNASSQPASGQAQESHAPFYGQREDERNSFDFVDMNSGKEPLPFVILSTSSI